MNSEDETKTEETTKTEEVEVGEEVVKAVAKGVLPSLTETIKNEIEKQFDAMSDKFEPVSKKNINAGGTDGGAEAPIDGKTMFTRGAIALIRKDAQGMADYNKYALEMRTKAGYGNEGVAADGGSIIALPEFEAEIEKLLPIYGVAFREADVRTIRSNQIKTNKLGSGVTMYETSEGGLKTGTKLTITQVTATLRKFAAIALATDELVEDAAIDFWAEVTDGFARERARIADLMVFTENGTTYKGALRTAGIFVETAGAAITSLTWDDLLNAQYKVPTEAAINGKFYMHRTLWNVLLQNKDNNNRYQFNPANGLFTPWGTPVVLVDIMPTSSDYGDANEPYVIFADLKRVKLYVKGGLRIDLSSEATVHDSDGNSVNLFEKNMSALRAEVRMVSMVKFPDAICAIGTGTVS